jgi:hypothetical protein
MTMKLSEAAETALINTPNRQGAAVQGVSPKVGAELLDAGYVTPAFNLTRKGQIARERVMDARLDAAF